MHRIDLARRDASNLRAPWALTLALDPRRQRVGVAGLTVQSLYNDMAAGAAYVNIHSTTVPSGEIRGTVEALWLP